MNREKNKNLSGRDRLGRFVSGENHPMKRLDLREKSRESHKNQKPWNTGRGGTYNLSERTRKLMSISHMGKNTWTKGRPSPLKGIPLSPEHRIKLSKSWDYHKHFKPITHERLRESRSRLKIPLKDTKPERMMQIALSVNGIDFEKHKLIRDGKRFYHQVDIFIEPNICVEVDGEHWHANPNKYKASDIICKGLKAKDVWARDTIINHELNQLGYQVIRIWENDIKKDVNNCAEKIIGLVKQMIGVNRHLRI